MELSARPRAALDTRLVQTTRKDGQLAPPAAGLALHDFARCLSAMDAFPWRLVALSEIGGRRRSPHRLARSAPVNERAIGLLLGDEIAVHAALTE